MLNPRLCETHRYPGRAGARQVGWGLPASPSPSARSRRTYALRLAVGGALFATIGCSVRPTTFAIVDYSQSGQPKRYGETFDEAYYDVNAQGDVDIVVRQRASGAANSDQPLTQIIHIKSFWRPIPGTTVAHATQINATVTYSLVSGSVGTILEGAGAVFFKEDRRKRRLTGRLESATLRLAQRAAGGEPLFKRAELTGTFDARRDPGRVARLIQETKARLGAAPP